MVNLRSLAILGVLFALAAINSCEAEQLRKNTGNEAESDLLGKQVEKNTDNEAESDLHGRQLKKNKGKGGKGKNAKSSYYYYSSYYYGKGKKKKKTTKTRRKVIHTPIAPIIL